MFQKIINLQYDFPPGFPQHARDLVEKLLVSVRVWDLLLKKKPV